jgi:TolA-binding protein
MVASLTGCVYYNTFYHAREAAREAELLREARSPDAQPDSRETELLERVAEKCTRILEQHPNSSWADDALLLLGETRYYQGRYESAEEHLNAFLKQHPDSALRPRAEYLLASVLIETGNPVSAESVLDEIANAQPPGDLADDALALIGEARYKRNKHKEAAEAFDEVLRRFPKSDRRAEVRYLAAQNYEAMGELDRAAREYEMAADERGGKAIAFDARMHLARVDIDRGDGARALGVLDDLESGTYDRDDLDRVLLLKGQALESLGRYDDAVSTYEGIAASHERSEGSAEAYYRIGLIRRDHDEQLDAASEAFKKSREEAPRSGIAAVATAASRDVERLSGYLATIEAYENERAGAEEKPGVQAPQSADTTGAVMTAPPFPGDSMSVVAMSPPLPGDSTSVAGPPARADSDSAGAKEAPEAAGGSFSAITLPDTGENGASASADTTRTEEPEDKVAVAMFRAAELYMFRFNDPERALTYYKDVAHEHPDSALAPKAALATAWIYDKKLENPTMARVAYQSVISMYPGTEFAEAAQESLLRDESTKH